MSDYLRPPWTVACQAPLSMEYSRQEHWSGSPFPSPDDLPDPGIKPMSLVPPAGEFFTPAPAGKPSTYLCYVTELLFPSWKKRMSTS